MTKDSIFPDDVREAADKMGGEFIKAAEFEDGLVLQFSKPVEKIVSRNPKYGADEKNYLVKQEILAIGETFHYEFLTPEGDKRSHDSNSPALFIGLKQVEELGVGDWLKITRTGKTDQTRYTVERVENANVEAKLAAQPGRAKYDTKEADEMSSGIPF